MLQLCTYLCVRRLWLHIERNPFQNKIMYVIVVVPLILRHISLILYYRRNTHVCSMFYSKGSIVTKRIVHFMVEKEDEKDERGRDGNKVNGDSGNDGPITIDLKTP